MEAIQNALCEQRGDAKLDIGTELIKCIISSCINFMNEPFYCLGEQKDVNVFSNSIAKVVCTLAEWIVSFGSFINLPLHL
jgi:hypothetical protein